MELRAIIWALALLLASPAWAIDDPVVTLTSSADVATRRATLISQVWSGALPTTLPAVTASVSDPFAGSIPNVLRVDQYVASMSNGQTNTSLLYVANSPNNRRVVMLNMGHQFTCIWPNFDAGYRTVQTMTALLGAGYSVFAFNMPSCGDTGQHFFLFSTYGNAAMRYFVEPAMQAMNYWDANATFSRYDFVGLSGGGFTSMMLAALDTRVLISIAVAGSLPGVQFSCSSNCLNQSDAEQSWTNFYTVAGFLDLYVMAGNGTNRYHLQILNQNDDCCFGVPQWTTGYSSVYSKTWAQYLAYYNANLQAAVSSALPVRYWQVIDTVAPQHQISTFALTTILSALASGTGGRH